MERQPNKTLGSVQEKMHHIVERLFHRSSLDRVSVHKESKAKAMDRHDQPVSSDTNKSQQNNEEDEGYTVHKPIALTVLTMGLTLTIFVVGLDDTIIAAAVPTITTTFHSLHDIGWYASAYLITSSALQPAFGKIYTHFHITNTFLFSMLVFIIGSAVCGAAQTSRMLIIGRAVAGAGSAGLFSGGMIMVGFAVPLRYRALWFAVLSSMYGITALIGPVLGGAITEVGSIIPYHFPTPTIENLLCYGKLTHLIAESLMAVVFLYQSTHLHRRRAHRLLFVHTSGPQAKLAHHVAEIEADRYSRCGCPRCSHGMPCSCLAARRSPVPLESPQGRQLPRLLRCVDNHLRSDTVLNGRQWQYTLTDVLVQAKDRAGLRVVFWPHEYGALYSNLLSALLFPIRQRPVRHIERHTHYSIPRQQLRGRRHCWLCHLGLWLLCSLCLDWERNFLCRGGYALYAQPS